MNGPFQIVHFVWQQHALKKKQKQDPDPGHWREILFFYNLEDYSFDWSTWEMHKNLNQMW